MTQPTLRFRPLRPAVAGDTASTLDLLISITTPPPPDGANRQRPPLNLALVIDRSGSMSGTKLSYARKAARFLAGQLTAADRLAIVTFDSDIDVLVPSRPAGDPQAFIAAINTIHSGGCTALFDGWLAGAQQVAKHLDPLALNRVLLLSDGQANEGLTNQGAIAEKVAGLTQRGISTSAFGLGAGFDEDLMGAIATAGDGTLAHIESPAQLADLYASELQGLANTLGRKVSLGIRAKNGAELLDLLNDLPPTSAGNHQLPSLRLGQELNVGVRLQLPAWLPNREICSVRLAWDAPGSGQRRKLIEHLTLPVKTAEDLGQMTPDETVAEEFAVLQSNRSRRQALEELDRGDLLAAEATLGASAAFLQCLSPSERTVRELQLLESKQALLKTDRNRARKGLRRESLRSSLDVWENQDDKT
ncbi:VWA domain-containing protein [Synechococcus sp. CS-205]|uniref:vWA domain-containing protein n=1 Tax=Synechococcus sp. CS-205 TaxID=2847984 RepID=UPI00223AEA7D|nr:VWA domain-containing protein [Synechococcus sp. CS-205]MCT0249056.1 VWA domain-containing protein [Synechococcus sp. CS-205]